MVSIGRLIERLMNPEPGDDFRMLEWRVKICGYRAIDPKGAAWWVEQPFTSDPERIRSDLGFLVAASGEGLHTASVAASEKLNVLFEGRKLTAVSVDAELGKRNFKDTHPDAQFLSDSQFKLRKQDGLWVIEPSSGAANETIVNGHKLSGTEPVSEGMRVAVGNSAKGIEKFPLTLESGERTSEPTPLLDALWTLAKMPEASQGEAADGQTWQHHRDATRSVMFFTEALCHLTTSAPEACGATFDDVAREIMARKIILVGYAPDADCYQLIWSIDRCEAEIMPSYSAAAEFCIDQSPSQIFQSLTGHLEVS